MIALCVQRKEIRNTWVVFLEYLRNHLSFEMQIPRSSYSFPFSNKDEFYFKCCVYAWGGWLQVRECSCLKRPEGMTRSEAAPDGGCWELNSGPLHFVLLAYVFYLFIVYVWFLGRDIIRLIQQYCYLLSPLTSSAFKQPKDHCWGRVGGWARAWVFLGRHTQRTTVEWILSLHLYVGFRG